MNPVEARKLWVEALRSGKYEQGMFVLHSSENRFCCLGVACDLYQREVGGLTVKRVDAGWDYADHYEVLPPEVQAWIGLASPRGDVVDELDAGEETLAALNDGGVTFSEIADLIESGGVLLSQEETS